MWVMWPVIRHQWFTVSIDLYCLVKVEIFLVHDRLVKRIVCKYIFIYWIIQYTKESRNVKGDCVDIYLFPNNLYFVSMDVLLSQISSRRNLPWLRPRFYQLRNTSSGKTDINGHFISIFQNQDIPLFTLSTFSHLPATYQLTLTGFYTCHSTARNCFIFAKYKFTQFSHCII